MNPMQAIRWGGVHPASVRRLHTSSRSMRLLALVALLAAAGCGGEGAYDDAAGDGATAAGEPPAAAGQSAAVRDGADRIEVTISDGQYAGNHEVSGQLHCLGQDGVWIADLSTVRRDGLRQATVALQGVPAGGGTAEEFHFSIGFGQIGDDEDDFRTFAIGGGARGSGTATAQRAGTGAIIRIEGTTYDGVRIVAVFRCATADA